MACPRERDWRRLGARCVNARSTEMTPLDDPFVPGGTFGRYEIIERIGEGGMASVWKALHLGLRKPVAIKTMRADLTASERARERFLREGEAIARIRHAHVVEVHDVGIVGDTPYLVMEFLEGEDLRSHLLRRGALPLVELADLIVPICAALSLAHDEGVVHRDIKPGNLFLARTRDRGVVPKVLDFGVSRLRDDRTGRVHTGTAVVLGTPRYMAPEQVRGARDVDGRADQYSLGVILYQGSTGVVPIDDTAVFELLRRVVSGDFVPPRRVRPELPEAFERVVLRAMATKPEARFPSMRDLGAALLPFASERTRVLYTDTLHSVDEVFALPPELAPPSAPSTFDAPNATVTLGGAPLEIPATGHASAQVRALSGLLAAVAVVAFGLSLWLAAHAPSNTPPAHLGAPVVPVAPLRPREEPAPPPTPTVQPLLPVAPTPTPVVTAEPPAPPPQEATPTRPRGVRVPRVSTPRPTVPANGTRATQRGARGVNAHDVD
jgi:eukaryotic-like serine/threonine-protein kinase